MGQTRDDYLVELNTKILSGEAEDLIMTSNGLPMERYIYMGVFEDLSGYLTKTKEINDENYFMNIIDAYRMKDGSLYQFLIAAAVMPTITFDNALMENMGVRPKEGTTSLTWREALDLGKEMYEKSTLPNTFLPDARTIVAEPLYWAGVNKNGFYARIEGSLSLEADYSEEQKEQIKQLIESWILQINAYKQADAKLVTISDEEFFNFYFGRNTALEVADNLERKLQKYLSE